MKKIVLLAAMLLASPAAAQFNEATKPGGPAAIGQAMAQPDAAGKVAIVQAPNPESGGLIQLKAFGWLEPYADTLVQLLISAGLAWFAKSRYSSYLDDSSRAALETFLKNRASSLIADGFVKMDGKTVDVHSQALAAEASRAAEMIPDAMKRFGLTPDVVAHKIVDAIPQVAAGAAMVAAAHEPAKITNPSTNITTAEATVTAAGDVNITGGEVKPNDLPPTAMVQS